MKKSLIIGSILVTAIALSGCSKASDDMPESSTTIPSNVEGRGQGNNLGGPRMGMNLNYDEIATTLELTQAEVEAAFEQAMDEGEVPGRNMEAVAEILGVTLEELRSAMGTPPMGEGSRLKDASDSSDINQGIEE